MLRVETERRKRDFDRNATFHAFVKRHLSLATRRQLDQVRISKKAAGNPRFGWDDVVTVCRDQLQGIGLADDVEAQPQVQCRPAGPQAPAAGGAPRAPAPHVPGLSTGGPTVVCDLCTSLGVGGANHPRERCFVDPKSRFHKAEVRQRRVAQARARGITIPQLLLDAEK